MKLWGETPADRRRELVSLVEEFFENKGSNMARKRETWALVQLAIDTIPRTLLYGPPGTGKTTKGVKGGNPEQVYKVTLHEEMPVAELIGHFIPEGDKFVWHDGVAIKAWREGARLVLDEVDRASGEAQTVLYAILDDPELARLTLPSNETVRPAEGFSAVATMNGEPADLPEALRDRFDVSVYVSEPHPDAIMALSEDLRDIARKTTASDAKKKMSMRRWFAFDRLRNSDGIDEHTAAVMIFEQSAEELLGAIRVARA